MINRMARMAYDAQDRLIRAVYLPDEDLSQ